MRIERRIFFDVKSRWSYICVLCEKFELHGWKVFFRPEINAVDIVKYTYEGNELRDDMSEIIGMIMHNGVAAGAIRSIYDLNDPKREIRYTEWE